MKIIQVIPTLCMGGAEIMCENLTYELKKLGNEVIVVSMYDKKTPIAERLENAGIDVRYLGKKSGIDFSIFAKLKKLFKDEMPDVVHSHSNAFKYAMIAAQKASVPVCVHTVHNVAEKELGALERTLAKYFYKKQKVIPVALSGLIQETVVKLYDISADFIPVVFNGIDLSKCHKKDSYEIGDTIKVLHIGRFAEQKNHKGLIDAFKLFHSSHPNSVLELIGEGALCDEIKEYVAECDLTDSVCFLGIQSNVYPFITEADIFVLPSLYEGIPITLIEAMATGIPIVATEVGGIPDMLCNGESAILTSLSSQEISDALIKILDEPLVRKKIGQNAYIASKAFSSKEMAGRYIEIYRSKH